MAVWEKFERTGILDTARASSTKSIADMSWGMAAKHRALMDYTTEGRLASISTTGLTTARTRGLAISAR